jgi:hypothetical protein
MRLDLRKPGLESWTNHSVSFKRDQIRGLSGSAQSISIASEGEVNLRELLHSKNVIRPLSESGL